MHGEGETEQEPERKKGKMRKRLVVMIILWFEETWRLTVLKLMAAKNY